MSEAMKLLPLLALAATISSVTATEAPRTPDVLTDQECEDTSLIKSGEWWYCNDVVRFCQTGNYHQAECELTQISFISRV
jgi:hypothetical protein